MKKHSIIPIVLLLVVSMMVFLVGCGSDKDDENINHDIEPPQIEQPDIKPGEREAPWSE